MAVEAKYQPAFLGDWGTPTPAVEGGYSTGTLSLADGVDLFYRWWQAPVQDAPVLVLMHGLGAHSGWFIDMGNELNARGLAVFAPDHRGFGRSGGPRGHVTDGTVYIRDMRAVLDEVQRRAPNSPIFVLGHSMGGIFAVHLAVAEARAGQQRLAGMILMNPWVADTTKTGLGTILGVLFEGMRKSPRLVRLAGGPEAMTTSPEATRMLNEDTYWVRAESASFLWQVTRLRSAMLRQAREVRIPALVIQCEGDLAVVPAASRRCYEALGSHDKAWLSLPVFAHDCEFEANRAVLDDGITEWIRRHSS